MGNEDQQLLEWTTSKCQDKWVIEIDEGWNVLLIYGIEPLRKILRGNSTCNISVARFCSLYTASFKISSQPQHPEYPLQLYSRLQNIINIIIREDIITILIKEQGIYLLKAFCRAWNLHKLMTNWFYKLFMHLDQGIVACNNLPTVTTCCLLSFYNHVFICVKDQIRKTMLDLLQSHREGIITDDYDYLLEASKIFEIMGVVSTLSTIKNISQCLQLPSNLVVYEQDFEVFFLQDTQLYYDSLSKSLLSSLDTISYILKVNELITQESIRCQKFLQTQTLHKVKIICINTLLTTHTSTLFKGLGNNMKNMVNTLLSSSELINNNEHSLQLLQYSNLQSYLSPLKLIHQLFLSIQNIESLSSLGSQLLQSFASEFTTFCVNLGEIHKLKFVNQIKTNQQQQQQQQPTVEGINHIQKLGKSNIIKYVEGIINLVTFFQELSLNLFRDHSVYTRSIKKASDIIVNYDIETIHSVELYIIYCEYYVTGEINDNMLLKTVMNQIFPFIENKDLFLELYQRYLSKRLLSSKKLLSLDTEKLMISWMKTHCGTSYTVKLEGMLNDFILSEETFTLWKQSSYFTTSMLDINVKVLTSCYWPQISPQIFQLPREMEISKEIFTKWYINTYSSRILKWDYSIGEVFLIATYTNNNNNSNNNNNNNDNMKKTFTTYEFNVTVEQATVLIEFNKLPTASIGLNIQNLHESTEITINRLKRVLHSLSCQNYKILSKTSNTTKITESDFFVPNVNFTNKHKKFKILMPISEETKEVDKNIETGRGLIIDAIIVRIMKSRQVLSHSDLISEILIQSSLFKPNNKFIKARIGILIEKDYIKRDENNPNLYQYLA